MKLTFEELKDKMPEITGLLLTHPNRQDDRVTEGWIKFRKDGVYAFVNFEQPFPEKIDMQKLVGAGNALNCSDYKKDNELIQYNEKNKIINMLNKSLNFKGNIDDTVKKFRELIETFTERFLHY